MRKMTLKHVSAISHAELFLEPAISKNPEPRFRHEIEKDLERLADVKAFVLYSIYNPGLPYNPNDSA